MAMMPPHGGGPPSMLWWMGRRKKADSGPANSGLTGDPIIEGPPEDEGPKDLRGRWNSLKQSITGTSAALPRVLRLVWDASPSTTLGLFATTAIAGVIPAAAAYTSLLLINAVVRGILINSAHLPNVVRFHDLDSNIPVGGPVLTAVNMIILIAVLQLALAAIAALLGTIRNITQQLLQNSVAMRIQLMVMEKAASLDLSFYEDPASYDLLRRAQTDSINRPVLMISTAFGLVQTLLTFITMIALLIANTFYAGQRAQVGRRYMTGFAWGNLSTIATSLTYRYVALQAIAGKLTLGHLTLYTAAAQSVQGSIQGILGGFSGMYEHNLYLNNLFELMAKEPSMPVTSAPVKVPVPMKGEIRFDNTSFAYPGAEKNALTDLSFTVKAGETLAVVGRNGAGKTTLFKLICRLYDPTEGRILIDGVDIRDFEPDDLREHIGAMFQDYVTYQATASENIGLGSVPDIANREAIEIAGRQAGADELITGLPQGYDTALGKWFDSGVNLSGGEWQKVALARGFMRDAKILLLDEPTSALDAQAEYDLFERLRSLTRGRTAVYISHRFSTVRRADRIIFLEHGGLVEEGTHEELMRLGGRYARLFRMQAAAYTGEDIEELVGDVG